MAPDLTMLQRRVDAFGAQLRTVRDDQWSLPTPCSEWTVRQLANHIASGGTILPMLLAGATAEEVMAHRMAHRDDDVLGDDPMSAYERCTAAELSAFAEPGALERIVHHPRAGDIPGSVLLGLRVTDILLHSWDLARALGADDTLDADAVAAAWSMLEPMAPMIATGGAFGTGPSGNVGADAPLQTRLLDLSGRRP